VLDGFSSDYLYFDAVRAIQQIKLASFAEHSPLLNDISGNNKQSDCLTI
jgi:hypothetical protein